MKKLYCILVIFYANIMILAGCASVPAEHFYTLQSTRLSDDSTAVVSAAGMPGITVASVTVPDAVDRPGLVIRTGPNRAAVMETRRWIEPLKSSIPRVIADDLSSLLGAPVSVQSDHASRNAQYFVLIDITRFDSTLNEGSAVDAIWSLRTAAGNTVKSGKSSILVPVHGGSFDELVAAHALALSRLSDQIAAQIKIIVASAN